MWPAMYVGHGFEGMAFRVDRELTGGVLPDVPHRTTEEVCQMPDCVSVHRNDNYIHIEPPDWPLAARSLQKLSPTTPIYIVNWIDTLGERQICAVVEHGRGTAYLANRRR